MRENRRVKTALRMARLTDRQDARRLRLRLPALARPQPHPGARRARVHRPRRGRPPARAARHRQKPSRHRARGRGGARPAKASTFTPLADIVASLAKAEREGTLREHIRFLCRASLLVVDEIGYLPVMPGGGNLFFQLVNARYEKGAMILTSNRGFAEWGEVFGDPVVATALLDRLLHHAVVIQIEGSSYRLRQHAALVPENARRSRSSTPRPSKSAAADLPERKTTIQTTPDHNTPRRQLRKIGSPHPGKLRCPLTDSPSWWHARRRSYKSRAPPKQRVQLVA